MVKIAIFGLTHYAKHRITRKLLKIDGYMLRRVWPALNCLSIHATYCVIIAGASPAKQKCGLQYVKTAIFTARCICISAVYAGTRCLSVCLSRSWVAPKRKKDIFEIFSPPGSQAILVFHTKRGGDIPTGTTLTGASNARRVWKKWRFSTNISLYLRNGYS